MVGPSPWWRQEVAPAKPIARPEPKLLRWRMLTFLRELREAMTFEFQGDGWISWAQVSWGWSKNGQNLGFSNLLRGWDGSKPCKTKDSSRFPILEGMHIHHWRFWCEEKGTRVLTHNHLNWWNEDPTLFKNGGVPLPGFNSQFRIIGICGIMLWI
jgi:hypothetical protein